MSNEQANKHHASFFQSDAFQIFSRIIVTSTTVTTVLYPLEIMRTLKQTDIEKKEGGYRSKNPFSMVSPLLFNFSRVHTLVNGYLNSNKSSLMRNTMLSNKDSVADNVEAVIKDEKEAKRQEYVSLLITAAIIAGFDTLLTQYHCNKGVFYALGISPTLTGRQHLSFAVKGMAARGGKTLSTTLGCIGSGTVISDALNNAISSETHPYAHALGTASISGFLVAPISNIGDVLYKNTLKQMNLATGEMPTYRATAQMLWRTRGPRVFLQGSALGGVYNTVAFVSFNAVNNYLNRFFDNNNRNNFFYANKPLTKVEADRPAPTKAF